MWGPCAGCRGGGCDADYQPPFAFTGKLHKVTLAIDRPKLSPEDIKKLEEAQRAAVKGRE